MSRNPDGGTGNARRRVVVTGLGPVSAIGIGREAMASALKAGRCGISVPARAAGLEVMTVPVPTTFRAEDHLLTQKAYLDRSSALALAAVALAVKDAELSREELTGSGVALGTAYGSLGTMTLFHADLVDKGPRLVRPFLFPHAYANTAISLIAMDYGLSGYHMNLSAGLVSAHAAIAAAVDCIRRGVASRVVAGGYDALGDALLTGLAATGRLANPPAPAAWTEAFEHNGSGILPGEGAAMLVLEDAGTAVRRGARICGEIVGTGLAGATGRSLAQRREAIARALRLALAEAGETCGRHCRVSVGANGDADGDQAEAEALADIGAGSGHLAPLALKRQMGETFGAAGALQCAAALMDLQGECSPPHTCTTALVGGWDDGGGAVAFVVGKWRGRDADIVA